MIPIFCSVSRHKDLVRLPFQKTGAADNRGRALLGDWNLASDEPCLLRLPSEIARLLRLCGIQTCSAEHPTCVLRRPVIRAYAAMRSRVHHVLGGAHSVIRAFAMVVPDESVNPTARGMTKLCPCSHLATNSHALMASRRL